jgi:hypothetical protein
VGQHVELEILSLHLVVLATQIQNLPLVVQETATLSHRLVVLRMKSSNVYKVRSAICWPEPFVTTI